MEQKNMKSIIIPDEMKGRIDEILEEQLFNANRYYAESNPRIAELMSIQALKWPTEFLLELRTRWEWHNQFYENLLEPAYLEILEKSFKQLSPKQITDLIQIYKTCCLVDEATLVMSGAIKKNLQENLSRIPVNYDGMSTQEATFMLLTPPVESFFTQYQIEHLHYVYLLKTDLERAEKYKKYLMKKYHANDEIVFQSRFNKKFSKKIYLSVENLLQDIKAYEISKEYKIKHFYFTLESPERKAYRDILIYDNVDEKLISSQLIGISGFLLRRQILQYLNESKQLINNGYIYEHSNRAVIEGLKKLLEERRQTMEKDIKPYKQRGMTCAIACMIMVLEYYKIIPKADWLYEKKYFRAYRSEYLEGTPFSALAWHFAKNDLETEIIHSEKNIFDNSQKTLSDYTYEKSMEEYKSYLDYAKEKGAKIINGVDINCNILKEKLEQDKLVILAGQVNGCLHAILLCGYEQDGFIVCDPLHKQKQKVTFEDIEKFMATPIGRWCVTVSQKLKNKEELMSRLDKFQKEATEKLKIDCEIRKTDASQSKLLKK